MLYLYDTIYKNEQEFQSLHQILRWWRTQFGHDPLRMFQELNITGADTKSIRSLEYKTVSWGVSQPVYGYRQELRRYQILDHLRRPIDIRTCPYDAWCETPVSPAPEPERTPEKQPGRKNPVRKHSEPSMRKRMLIADQTDDDIYAASRYIVKDKSRVRRKTLITSYDCAAHRAGRQLRHWQNTGTWKERSKARRQYGRHD